MQDLNQDLIRFIHASPTPFHAVLEMQKRLLDAGFTLLDETQAWLLEPGKAYVLSRNQSSLIAFIYGEQDPVETGIRMLGAHTDSPCLKVKPNADIYHHDYWQLGVEVYGGVLLNPWFDRELSLAGRVSILDEEGDLQHLLVNMETAVGMVPSLAIHLDREANKSRSINAQTDLPVVMAMDVDDGEKPALKTLLKQQIAKQYPAIKLAKVLDYELSFYDVQPGRVYGVRNEFLASARLDNLLSCYIGLQALIGSDRTRNSLLICNDHEEVGSGSAAGAQGTLLKNFLLRLKGEHEARIRMIQHSMMISVDNAHGLHPNHSDRHDANHGPLLNAGPVIKVNASQRYASNSETQSIFRALCEKNDIPVQSFVVRSDMGCGTTIGPITATELGIRTLDIGVPTFGMHSIRETAGAKDTSFLYQALLAFLNQ